MLKFKCQPSHTTPGLSIGSFSRADILLISMARLKMGLQTLAALWDEHFPAVLTPDPAFADLPKDCRVMQALKVIGSFIVTAQGFK